jgi:hypothetical protein
MSHPGSIGFGRMGLVLALAVSSIVGCSARREPACDCSSLCDCRIAETTARRTARGRCCRCPDCIDPMPPRASAAKP